MQNFSAKNRAVWLQKLAAFDATVEKTRPAQKEERVKPTGVSSVRHKPIYRPCFELYRGTLYLDGVYYAKCVDAPSARREVDQWAVTHLFSDQPPTLVIV